VRLAVAATAPLGAAVLEGLAKTHDIEVLVTRPDRPRGRGRQVGAPPAKEAAERLGIPVEQPERLESFPGTAPVIVAAYGALIPSELLEDRLWLNVHPSLLPRWRGAAPVERAIMAGDTETGVTIHRTTAELDAGPVAAQRTFPIAPDDDAGVVYERAAALAVELLNGVLPEPAFERTAHRRARRGRREAGDRVALPAHRRRAGDPGSAAGGEATHDARRVPPRPAMKSARTSHTFGAVRDRLARISQIGSKLRGAQGGSPGGRVSRGCK